MANLAFEELLVRLLEGSLSEHEHAVLMSRLLRNPEIADRVVKGVIVDDLIHEHVDNRQEESHSRWAAEFVESFSEQILPIQEAAFAADRAPTLRSKLRSSLRRWRKRTFLLLALAGVVLAVCLFQLRLQGDRSPIGIARDSRVSGVEPVEDHTGVRQPIESGREQRFEGLSASKGKTQRVAIIEGMTKDVGSQFSVGDEFTADDRLSLREGNLRLHFLAGVEAILSGPAEIEFISAMQVILRSGRFTALAEPPASGFTVITPRADVVDLGTSFGVGVETSGAADVLVFEGVVDVHFDSAQGLPTRTVRRLTVGEAVRVLENGGVSPVKMVEEGLGAAGWSTTFSDTGSSVKRISDNLVGPGQSSYYALVRGGFDEDARAYVDRTYEWNSFSEEEFPEVLRGADYIRTINSQKLNLDLEISLEIQRDSDLYILIDARIPPSNWLKRSFTKTALKIGMDEYRPRAEPSLYTAVGPQLESARTLGKGPGKSVDQRFHLWKRSVRSGDLVTLGSVVDRSAANSILQYELNELSMYGIVIVPTTPDPPGKN